MASIEEALVSYLTGYSGLVALVGTRVKPFHIPQSEELPCVTYMRIDTPRSMTHSSSGASGDLVTPRFQFDSWAIMLLDAQSIGSVLQAALHGKKGNIGSGSYVKKMGLIYADGGFPMEEPELKIWRWVGQYIVCAEE